MKIVIDISENDYELACRWPNALIAVYAHAIKNGIPLPEGVEILTKEAYSDLCTRAADVPDFESEEYVEERIRNYDKMLKSGILDCIKESPSVEPERKTGKWIIVEENAEWFEGVKGTVIQCKDCHFIHTIPHGAKMYKFCPMCSKRMEVDTP